MPFSTEPVYCYAYANVSVSIVYLNERSSFHNCCSFLEFQMISCSCFFRDTNKRLNRRKDHETKATSINIRHLVPVSTHFTMIGKSSSVNGITKQNDGNNNISVSCNRDNDWCVMGSRAKKEKSEARKCNAHVSCIIRVIRFFSLPDFSLFCTRPPPLSLLPTRSAG